MAFRNGAVLLMICLVWAFQLSAKDVLSGPVTARVLRVIDGDTIEVAAHVWLGQTLVTLVRLDGVDTPEIHQPDCPSERIKGRAAKEFIIARLEGADVTLRHIRYGKFAGRVVAQVEDSEGMDVSLLLVDQGLGVPATSRSHAWCTAQAPPVR